MVRLINEKNIKTVCSFVYGILHIQERFTHIKEINNPNITPCIYVMWHADQFSVYGLQNKSDIYIQISYSVDGEIVSHVAQKMGFNTIRGSAKRKGSVSSALGLMGKLKEGKNVVIMIDGPNGPLHTIKKGAIRLAKDTGAPIVPMHWYSNEKTFIKLPSWDKMTTPIGPCKIINLYGKPIYVKENDDENLVAETIKSALDDLEYRAPEEFEKAKTQKLWEKQ